MKPTLAAKARQGWGTPIVFGVGNFKYKDGAPAREYRAGKPVLIFIGLAEVAIKCNHMLNMAGPSSRKRMGRFSILAEKRLFLIVRLDCIPWTLRIF